MRIAGSYCRGGGRSAQVLLGWTLASMLVLAAVFGPPLTGQSVPTIVELRRDVLMIDREFERLPMLTPESSPRGVQARGDIA